MNKQNSRSKALLDKVYDHLDGIDVHALSMNDLKDFLEVVQRGQFLETYGQMPSFDFCGWKSNETYSDKGGSGAVYPPVDVTLTLDGQTLARQQDAERSEGDNQ